MNSVVVETKTEHRCNECFQRSCICDPDFTKLFQLNGYANEIESDLIEIQPIKLTTATLNFTIGTRYDTITKTKFNTGIKIDPDKIYAHFPEIIADKTNIFWHIKPKPDIKSDEECKTEDEKRRNRAKKQRMQNMVEIKASFYETGVYESSNFSIKIFFNGSVGIMGVKNPVSIYKLSVYILDLLKKCDAIEFLNPDETKIKVWNMRTSMTNTMFRIRLKDAPPKQKHVFLQRELFRILLADTGTIEENKCLQSVKEETSYLNIKFRAHTGDNRTIHTRKQRKKSISEVSILAYSTGNITLVGKENAENIRKAHDYITSVFVNHPEIFARPKVKNR